MDFDSSINCEKTSNVDVPMAFVGLRILLVDQDVISLSNMTTVLEELSFKVTAIQQASIALAILQKQIDKFDLVMMDVNMPGMDYLEFIKSTQLIKDIPIILISLDVKTEMVKEAMAQGACSIFMKQSISSEKLKNIWRHVQRHHKKINHKLQCDTANQVEGMDNTFCTNKLQDGKRKSTIVNSFEAYQDQAIGSLIKNDHNAEGSKRMRSANEETQDKGSDTSEEEEDHSLVSNIRTKTLQNKGPHLKWTKDIDEKFNKVVLELGEKARPKHVLEMMSVPDLTQQQVAYRLKKYRNKKQQEPHVQPTASLNFNEGHHSNLLNSNNFSTNFNESSREAYIPQSFEVPSTDPPNPNDYSLDWWNDLDEFLELDNFHTVNCHNWLDDAPAHKSSTQDNNFTSKNQNP